MIERTLEIRASDGAMEAFITHPSENGPFPAVIIYMDMWGWREELFDIARRVATVGYYCMVPDVYYRQGKVRFAFRNDKGQMLSFVRLDDKSKQAVLAPMHNLTDAMVVEDMASILDFMDRGEPVRPGSMGLVGYCMGGRHVLRLAGRYPRRFRATACLQGVEMVTDRDDSPHLSARVAEGEIYCGYAELDRFTPLSVISKLDETLRQGKVMHRYEVHKGASHGYPFPERDVFDKQAFNRDWELIFGMFHRQIPPYRDLATAR